MRPWHHGTLAAYDCETTGLDVERDRIVTAALWRLDGASGERAKKTWLADPGIPIPEQATRLHGVTTAHARQHGRPAGRVVAEIADQLAKIVSAGVPLVVFNAPYDLTLLDRECRRHGLSVDLRGLRIVDPLVLDKQADPDRRTSRKLTHLCAHYRVALTGDAHNAEADALAAARIAWKIGQAHPHLAALDPEALHTAQARWYARQAADHQAYLRRTTNPNAVIDGSWPLVPTK